MKNQKLKALAMGGIAAMAMGLSSGVSAQGVPGLYPAGPIWINGYVSVDNTPKGGNYDDFACKVKGYGRIGNWSNQIIIEGIQALHRSSGQIPRGCHSVLTANFPWTLTINAAPTPDSAVTSSTTNVTLAGVVFNAPPEPGCGTDSGATGGTINTGGGGTITWRQDIVPFVFTLPKHNSDPAYSTLLLDNALIAETTGPGCRINGILKITRPVAPSYTEVPK